jgi:hypothetical protein
MFALEHRAGDDPRHSRADRQPGGGGRDHDRQPADRGRRLRGLREGAQRIPGRLTRGPAELDYYVSNEADYLAQQVAGHYDLELMNQQLNLSFGSSYGWDDIEPLADDDTQTAASTKTTLHMNTWPRR